MRLLAQLRRNLEARKREKQEEQRARDRIRSKLGKGLKPHMRCTTDVRRAWGGHLPA